MLIYIDVLLLQSVTFFSYDSDGCKYLEGFVEVLPTLTCAHSLGKLLVALSKTCSADHIKGTISTLHNIFIRYNQWFRLGGWVGWW